MSYVINEPKNCVFHGYFFDLFFFLTKEKSLKKTAKLCLEKKKSFTKIFPVQLVLKLRESALTSPAVQRHEQIN